MRLLSHGNMVVNIYGFSVNGTASRKLASQSDGRQTNLFTEAEQDKICINAQEIFVCI